MFRFRHLGRPSAILVAAALAGSLLSGIPVHPAFAADLDFTIGVLPDTQNLSATNYTAETTWFADHASSLNLAFVAHLGDLTDNATVDEFAVASAAQQVLEDASIPSSVLPGNHDGSITADWTNYSAAFPVSRYSGEAWWGGAPDASNRNSYQLFTAGGLDFIIVSLEYAPSASALSWASGILAANPSRRAIVATHDYLINNGTRDSNGNSIWNGVVDNNCNVFLVVSGHIYPGDTHSTDTNSCGDTVHQVLQDWQDRSTPQMRYFTFRPSANVIDAYDIVPPSGPASLSFSLPYDMGPSAPGAPTGVTATGGNASADLSWTAPAYDGGSPITDYQVTPYVGATAGTPVLVGSAATSKTVTGLVNGTTYTFKVAAINTNGTGSQSAASNAVTPQVPPWTAYIDTNGAGTGTDANALSLTPPNGTTCSAPCDPFPSTDTFTLKDFSDGSALTGIQMQVDANVDVVSNNPTTDPFTFGDQGTVFGGKVSGSGVYSFTSTAGHKFDLNFTGLDDTKTYTVVVGSDRFDTNTPNVNRWSQFQLTGAASFTQSATTIPEAYIVGNAGASVAFHTGNNTSGYVARWTGVVPVDGAFSVVTNYFANPVSGGTVVTSSYPPSALMLAEEGPSGPSAPGAPTGVTATGGNASADLSWTAPAYDGGSPITDYQVTPYVGATAGTPVLVGSAATSKTVTGLVNGTTYTFKVAAINTNGTGSQSAASNAVTPQAPPVWTAYIDTNGAGTGTDANALSLTPPNGTTCSAPCDPFPSTDTFTLKDFSDGSALTGIQMQVDANVDVVSNNPTTDPFTFGDQGTVFGGKVSGSGVYSFTSTAGHKFDLNFTGLDDTKTYTVVVGSDRFDTNTPNVNRWSQFQLTGAASFTQSATTIPEAYIVGNAGASVAFHTGNNTSGYVARWTGVVPVDGAFSVVTNYFANPVSGGTVVTSSYPPSALMLAEEGPSGPSAPGAPTGVTATGGNASADLSWTAPAYDGGSPITDYQVTPYVGATAGTPVLVGSAATSKTVTGLVNGTTYTFKVAAINTNGTGSQSAASNAVTPQAPLDNWTAYADLRTSSNSNNNAANVLEIPEGTIDQYGTGSPINPATSFTLLDLASGRDTDARLQVDNSGLYISSDNGSSFTGGPAFAVFDGIVDGAGVYSEQAGAIFQVNLSGLDPAKRYTVVATSNRNQDPANRASDANGDERWSDFELVGADASTQASGGTTTVVSDTHVRFKSENNTARGDLARWTDIDPGADGAFSVKANVYLLGDSDRSYVPVQLMLQETTPSTPGTHTISGTVTAGGDPVDGAIVYVFKAADSSYVGNAVTAADGSYTISLPDGTYKLWIQTNTGGYPDQAYGPDGTFANATPVDTSGGNQTADVVLAGGTHTISGTVTAGGDPVDGAIVYVFKAADSSYVGNAVTAADGSYTISLPDGTYKLWIQTNTGGYPDQAYGPDGTFANATPVDTSGGNQTADVVLAGGTHTISGTVTAGGDPVAGAIVYVFKAADSSYVGNAVTAADGSYTISLPDGTYKLWIQTNTGGYPDQAYGPDGTFANATPVDTSGGNQTADVVLAGGTHTISGTVTAGGDPVDGCHRLRVQGRRLVLRRQRGHRGRRVIHHQPARRHLQALDPDQHRWLPRPGLRPRRDLRERHPGRHQRRQPDRGRRARGGHPHHQRHRHRRRRSRRRRHRLRVQGRRLVLRRQRGHRGRRVIHHQPARRHLQALDPDQHRWLPRPGLRPRRDLRERHPGRHQRRQPDRGRRAGRDPIALGERMGDESRGSRSSPMTIGDSPVHPGTVVCGQDGCGPDIRPLPGWSP